MTNSVAIREVLGFQTLYNNRFWHSLDTIDVLNNFRRYMMYSTERNGYRDAKRNNGLGFKNGYLTINGKSVFPIARKLNKEEKQELKTYLETCI